MNEENMKEIKIILHESIGPARLGMTRDEIRGVLGTPSRVEDARVQWDLQWPDKDYFFNNAFQVNYDADLKAEFIEVASEPDFIVTFDGVPVHDSSPEVLLGAINKHAKADLTDTEYPLNQYFPDIALTLFREHSDEDSFDAIGIGTEDFYKKGEG
jgi:hypothetical protein